jgi:mlo protein
MQGKVSLISTNGVHQLHIFIFVLAVFHVAYSVATMALARLKVSTGQACEQCSLLLSPIDLVTHTL